MNFFYTNKNITNFISLFRFQKHIDTGLLEVIAPSEGYYPDFNNLRNTLGDPVERVRLVCINKQHFINSRDYEFIREL